MRVIRHIKLQIPLLGLDRLGIQGLMRGRRAGALVDEGINSTLLIGGVFQLRSAAADELDADSACRSAFGGSARTAWYKLC